MSSNFKCSVHPRYNGIYPPPKDRAGHVCEMCDWVWHGSDNFHAPRLRPWRHAESTFTLGSGGDKFGESLKAKALKVVQVKTDDAEIALGFLIRDDEDGQIRVGYRASVVKPYQGQQEIPEQHLNQRRRTEWRVDAIARDRITELRVLS
jgi:hypothetical protein